MKVYDFLFNDFDEILNKNEVFVLLSKKLNLNIMKKLIIALTLISSVAFSGNVSAQGTIVDVAVGNEDFSTLVAALKAADLVSALQGAGPFTVFAPTNAAFAKIDSKTLT